MSEGMQNESLVLIRVRTADPVWLCIFHYSLSTAQFIQAPLENKVLGLTHWSLVSPCCYFFLFVFRLTPWSAGALWVHFFAWASKTHVRACPRWGTTCYSRGCLCLTWTVQVPCLGFLCKPRNISLFHSSIFLLQSSLFISFYIHKSLSSHRCCPLEDTLDPRGAGPWYFPYLIIVSKLL